MDADRDNRTPPAAEPQRGRQVTTALVAILVVIAAVFALRRYRHRVIHHGLVG